jgi:hypothetical protein
MRAAGRVRSGRCRRLIIVKEHAVGRGVEIVKLSLPDGIREGDNGTPGEDERQRQNDEQHAHDLPPFQRKAPVRMQIARTVSELAGITTAAISGLINPATESAAATML